MKHKLLIFVFALSSSLGFAQLTIKPAGNQETYMYVKNELLYVKEEIKLIKNPGADTDENTNPSIYLRGSGQLIQGGDDSGNWGNGYLSVIRSTNPTNAYAYYYWGAMVGQPGLAGSDQGNEPAGVKNIYEPKTGQMGRKARQVATTSGKEGFTEPQLTISKRWLYTHMTPGTEAAGDYVRINETYDITPGFGFTMKGVNLGTASSAAVGNGHKQLYEFRGRPHNGDFIIPVKDTDAKGDRMITLAGNPYPSTLDLKQVFEDPENTEKINAIYFYDEDRSEMSHLYSQKPYGYATWTPSSPASVSAPFAIWKQDGSSTGTTGSGTVRSATQLQYSPIGQGFMITGNATTDIKIKNSHRVYKKDMIDHIYRGTATNGTLSQEPEERGIGNVQFTTASGETAGRYMRLYVTFDKNVTRDLILSFSHLATDGYDWGMDAASPGGLASDAAFLVKEESGKRAPYVINSVRFDQSKRIPLSITANKRARVDIKVAEEINKPYQEAYLYDYDTDTYYPLNNQNKRGIALDLAAGKYDDRFYIVFEKIDIIPWKGVDKETFKTDVSVFQNNPERQLEVRNPERHEIKSLSVFDMTGKQVLSKTNLGDATTHSFYTGNLSDGVYIIKLITVDDIPVDYKAVIYNK